MKSVDGNWGPRFHCHDTEQSRPYRLTQDMSTMKSKHASTGRARSHRRQPIVVAVALLASATLAGALALAATTATAAAIRNVSISGHLVVTSTPNANCNVESNAGHGTMTPFGAVTFTTCVNTDGTAAPCGFGSMYAHGTRTIDTDKGKLVLLESGVLCGGTSYTYGWGVEGSASTGEFHGAIGSGSDFVNPPKNTAAPKGTINLYSS
jgi:hypothetical protein